MVTAAALSGRVKTQVSSLGPCRYLKGAPGPEESTWLAGHGGLFSYSQPCDTAVSVPAASFDFRLLKGLTLWIC